MAAASVDNALLSRVAGVQEEEEEDLTTKLFELANSQTVTYAASSSHTLIIRQDPATPNTGGCVWETAYALALWARTALEPEAKVALGHGAPLRILEVGAGCGFLSLALAHMGCRVTATEQSGVLANLSANVSQNDPRAHGLPGQCTAARLHWGDDEDIVALTTDERYDYLVGTDVVYMPDLVLPLLRTLWACSSDETVTLLCLQQRCVASHALLLARAGDFFSDVSHLSLGDGRLPELQQDARLQSQPRTQSGSEKVLRTFETELECELLRFAGRRPLPL